MTRLILETSVGDVCAEYGGGSYINIGFGEAAATEIINVYDYQKGCSTIENTPEVVERKIVKWLQELEPDIEIYSVKKYFFIY